MKDPRRRDRCIVDGCNKKTLNYTGIAITNPMHIMKMNEIMLRDKVDCIEIFNNCKQHCLMLMNGDGE